MEEVQNKEFGKLYAVIPPIMMDYVKNFVDEFVKHKDLLVLIDSTTMNPEQKYYYQKWSDSDYQCVKKD